MPGKWPLVLGLAVFLVVAGCDHLPGAIPEGDTWHLTLTNQKTSIYGGSACVNQNSEPFCKTWVEDAYVFSGTLHRSSEWSLDVGSRGSFFATDAAQSVDTVIVNLIQSSGCASYEFFFRTHHDSIYGTFLHTSDCHAAGNRGTFVGRP